MAEPPPPHTSASPDPLPDAAPAVGAPAARRSTLGQAISSVALDVSPLRDYRDFRLLFVGQGVSFAGTMITYVAVPYQAYVLSRSSLVVGLVSLTELLPILVMAFVGGALADAIDRRRMVRITELSLCAVTGALALNAALPHPQLWVLFVSVGIAAGLDALQRPSLDAMVPRLVARDRLSAAAALESLRGNLGQVLGPPVAGVLIEAVRVQFSFNVALVPAQQGCQRNVSLSRRQTFACFNPV